MSIRDLFEYRIYKKELEKYVGKRKRIVIPKWIKKIGVNAFYNSHAMFVNTNQVSELATHAFHNSSKIREVVLNEKITNISAYCFSRSSIETVIFTNSVKSICNEAFSRCYKLVTLDLPESLEVIYRKAFRESSLEYITIPKNVKIMGEGLFENSTFLRSVEFENEFSILPDSTFAFCQNLSHVKLPSTLEVISDFAFLDCGSLEKISFSENIKKVGVSAFEGSGIKKINLSNASSIGKNAFYDCKDLRQVTLSEDLLRISEDAFGCSGLTEITLPSKLEYIDFDSMSFTNLKEIKIPSSVKEIANHAFRCCRNLNMIIIENSDTIIKPNAFKECENIKTIIYKGEILDVKNISFVKLGNNELEFLYKYREKIKTLKASINISILKKLEKAELLDDFFDNAYYKNYRTIQKIYKTISSQSYKKSEEELFLLCYTMGVFNKSLSQKSSELIKDALTYKKLIRYQDINRLVARLTLKKVDEKMVKEITDSKGKFIMGILELSKNEPEFFGLCLEFYDDIQKSNKANTPSHRQLKPNVKKFYDYFNADKFIGVETIDDMDLAKEIGKFYNEQDVYDLAKKIMGLFRKNKTIRTIISDDKRKEIMVDLDKIKREIYKNLDNLDEVLDKVYYEFLNKDDGKNLIVGNYMDDCCAHITGVGEDIAFASILDPNTQTLIIKDAYSNIISKAVFSINSDNEMMVNGIYVDETAIKGKEKKVVNKYLEAFKIFIDDYKLSKGIDIGGVYVADNSPMLDHFTIYSKRMGVINVLDYTKYKVDRPYKGDCRHGVACIFDNRENIVRKYRK